MPRGYSKETRRGDAAAATWMFRGDESRRCNADVPRRRVAAMQRGYSAETRRGDAAAATRGSPRRTIGAGVRVVRRGRRGLRLRAPQKYGRVPKAAVGQDRSRPRVARGAPHEGGPALGPRDGADAVLQRTARGVVAQTAAGGRRVRGVACRGLCFGRLRRAGDGDPGLRGRGVVHAAIGLFRVAERGARPRAARPGAGHRLPEPRVRGGRGGRVRDAGLLRGTAWIFRGVGSAELEAARRRKNLSPKRSSFVDVRGRVAATPRGATWIFREGDRPSSTRGFARRFERTAAYRPRSALREDGISDARVDAIPSQSPTSSPWARTATTRRATRCTRPTAASRTRNCSRTTASSKPTTRSTTTCSRTRTRSRRCGGRK